MSSLTPKGREEITKQLREKHQPIFDALGEPDAVFIPKMAHFVKGLEGLQMGFFDNELRDHAGTTIYTEKVSRDLEPEDPKRTLYKFIGNPHYEEEYESEEKQGNNKKPYTRYFVPVDEMDIVNYSAKKSTTVLVDNDESMSLMTIKDFFAIMNNKPVSDKEWLNQLIQENSGK